MVKANSAETSSIIQRNSHYIKRFCNTSEFDSGLDLSSPDKAMTAIITGAELYLPLAGLIDIEQEVARLEKSCRTLRAKYSVWRKSWRMKALLPKLLPRLLRKSAPSKQIIPTNGIK